MLPSFTADSEYMQSSSVMDSPLYCRQVRILPLPSQGSLSEDKYDMSSSELQGKTSTYTQTHVNLNWSCGILRPWSVDVRKAQ